MNTNSKLLEHVNALQIRLLHEYQQFRSHEKNEVAYLRGSCQAVAQFFKNAGGVPHAAAAFMDLTKYFDAMTAKGETSLVGIGQMDEARPRTPYRSFLKNMAAACMDVLMSRGRSKAQAAARVARDCARWPGIGDGSKITATTIGNWRDQLLAGSTGERGEFDKLRTAFCDEPDPVAKVMEILRDGPPSGPKKT